jgi:small subunit ribosomal protein S2
MTDAKQTTGIDAETKKLFELGAHLGHKKNRLHPKSRKYIYKIVNGVSVIDLTMSIEQLDKAKKVLAQYGKEGKFILVVATKKVAAQYVAELCKNNNVPSITSKWLPGLLTNFDTIMKNVRKLKQMQEDKESGAWDKFVKHERMKMDKEIVRLKKFYEGLLVLEKKPDLLLIVDIKKEKNALKEAHMYEIPVVALTDTNANPNQATYPIVVNDDSAEVVQYVMKEMIDAYIKGKK